MTEKASPVDGYWPGTLTGSGFAAVFHLFGWEPVIVFGASILAYGVHRITGGRDE